VTYVRVMRRVCFSVYNLVKVLLFVETPAMVKQIRIVRYTATFM